MLRWCFGESKTQRAGMAVWESRNEKGEWLHERLDTAGLILLSLDWPLSNIWEFAFLE
jgi:hypothetical protein